MIERRRFSRLNCDTLVSITICDSCRIKKRDDKPITGKMIDFSLHGACLLPDKIQYGCRHIFKSTQHRNDYIIRLEYIADDENNPFIIYGNSAWYNQSSSDDSDSIRFKLGIEFLDDQNEDTLREFYARMANRQNAKKGWLKKIFKQ